MAGSFHRVFEAIDNHASHTTLEAVTHAKSNNVVMLSLPPQSSHKTQPLDPVFFKPFKNKYNQVADNWQCSHPGQTITVYDVAELFKTAYERTATLEKAIVTFRVTGIYPLDSTVFSEEDFLPSEVTEQNQDDMGEEHTLMVTFPGNDKPTANPEPSHVDQFSDDLIKEPLPILEPGPGQEPSTIPGPSSIRHPTSPTSSITIANVSTVSAADIMPLLKLAKKRKRTKRGLKSTILTSTPNKLHLEEKINENKNVMKHYKSAKKVNENKNVMKQKSAKKVTKTLFSRERKVDSGSSSQPDTDMSLHDDSLDISFEVEDSNQEEEEKMVAGSSRKSSRKKSLSMLFVAKILERIKEGFKVQFCKKSKNTMVAGSSRKSSRKKSLIKKEQVTFRHRVSWYTDDLRAKARELRDLYNLYKATKDKELLDAYNIRKQLYGKQVESAKRSYYCNLMADSKNISRTSWRIIHDIAANVPNTKQNLLLYSGNSIASDPQQVAELLGQHFSSIIALQRQFHCQ
ncbi:DDE superfamily endonuclease [Popillia japonica]|uniref:DDE superfamily endonuclease n=1 Tax=Popillia japonica TaxID=7064 RepID=A0AAW1NKF5_POPJA